MPPATPAHALLSAARSLLRPADTIATNKPIQECSTPEPVSIATISKLPIEESPMPEPGVSDLKDVVEAINKLCETMTTYGATETDLDDQIHMETTTALIWDDPDPVHPDQVTVTTDSGQVQHVEPQSATLVATAIDQTIVTANEVIQVKCSPQHRTRPAPAVPARYREMVLPADEAVVVECVDPEYFNETATAVQTRCYDTMGFVDPEEVTLREVKTFGPHISCDATGLVHLEQVTVSEVEAFGSQVSIGDPGTVHNEMSSTVIQEVETFGSQVSIVDPVTIQNEGSVVDVGAHEGCGSRWSDASQMSVPANEDVPSEQYYTASSEVSLVSDSSEVLPVTSGHVAAMRERFENMTRVPPRERSVSPDARHVTPSPDRLGG